VGRRCAAGGPRNGGGGLVGGRKLAVCRVWTDNDDQCRGLAAEHRRRVSDGGLRREERGFSGWWWKVTVWVSFRRGLREFNQGYKSVSFLFVRIIALWSRVNQAVFSFV